MIRKSFAVWFFFGYLIFTAGAPLGTGAQNSASSQPSVTDKGTFVLRHGGKEYGTENFSIQADGGMIVAQGESQLHQDESGGGPLIKTYSKLTLDAALDPQTYYWSAETPQRYNLLVDFTTPMAKSQLHQPDGKDNIREFKLKKDVVVLDNNCIHHYQILADRYARTSGGKQAFDAFIPQAALPGQLTVQDAGMESLKISGKDQPVRHLVVTSDNAEINLWVDGQSKLQRLYWSDAQVEALRLP